MEAVKIKTLITRVAAESLKKVSKAASRGYNIVLREFLVVVMSMDC